MIEVGYVSVPLRGKEGAGPGRRSGGSQPGYCGSVSVPLRGKEGAGPNLKADLSGADLSVSVPLRGKEGAGRNTL